MSRGPMPGAGPGGGAGFRSPPVKAPEPPSWLEGEGIAEWNRVVPLLLDMGMLGEVDRVSLAAYCQAAAELVECTKVLDAEGRFFTEPVQNSKGDVIGERKKAHPALAAQRDALARVKAYLAEFGLTPAARVRMRFLRDVGPDELSNLLAGAPG